MFFVIDFFIYREILTNQNSLKFFEIFDHYYTLFCMDIGYRDELFLYTYSKFLKNKL